MSDKKQTEKLLKDLTKRFSAKFGPPPERGVLASKDQLFDIYIFYKDNKIKDIHSEYQASYNLMICDMMDKIILTAQATLGLTKEQFISGIIAHIKSKKTNNIKLTDVQKAMREQFRSEAKGSDFCMICGDTTKLFNIHNTPDHICPDCVKLQKEQYQTKFTVINDKTVQIL